MKVIKAKVYYTRSGGVTTYSGGYPPEWESQKIPFIVYGELGTETDGRTFQWVLATVPDELHTKMINNTERCVTVTQLEAKTFGDAYRPQIEIITDQRKVLTILAKSTRGEELTLSEKDAINPKHPERGVNMSKCCEDFWNEYGVQW